MLDYKQLTLFVEMNWKQHRDSMKLHFPTKINTNEIILDGLSASLDSVTTGISTKALYYMLAFELLVST